MLESDYLSFHTGIPMGEVITIEASSTSLDEDFTIIVQPNDNLLFAPIPLTIITLVIVLFGMFSSLSMTKNKHRRFLNLEFALVPIIGLIYLFSYPPLFVFAASGVASMLWIVTGLISPRKQKSKQTNSNQKFRSMCQPLLVHLVIPTFQY